MAKIKKSRIPKQAPYTKPELQNDNKWSKQVSELLAVVGTENSILNDKILAMNRIMILCNNNSSREELMKQNIMGLIFDNNLLKSTSWDVVNCTLEILKIMAFEDGYPICTHLWKKRHIWDSIEHDLNSLKSWFNEFSHNGAENSKKELLFELTENVFGLILALVSGSDAILEEVLGEDVNNEKMVLVSEFLVNLLRWVMTPDDENSENSGLKVSLGLLNSVLSMIYEFCSESSEFVDVLVFKFGINLQDLIAFETRMTNHINNASRVYIEAIKFQIFEVSGVSLALSGVAENQQDEALAKFEAQREEIFLEIFNNLTSFLKNSLQSFDVTLESHLFDLSSLADDKKSLFVEKYNEKLAANDEVQAVEVSFDVMSTLVEFCGSEAENSYDDYEKLLVHFNKNKLVAAFIDSGLFSLLSQCLTKYNSKLELHALDWFINISVLLRSLKPQDLPLAWINEVSSLWQLISASASSLSSHNTNNSNYNLHVSVKLLQFLNATFDAQQSHIKDVLRAFISICDNVSVEYSSLTGKKLRSKEAKEFIDLAHTFYTEFVQLLGSLGQLPSIETNSVVGEYIFKRMISTQPESSLVDILPPETIIQLISTLFDIYGDKQFIYDVNYRTKGYNDELKRVKELLKNDIFKRKIDKKSELKQLAFATLKDIDRFVKYKENE